MVISEHAHPALRMGMGWLINLPLEIQDPQVLANLGLNFYLRITIPL